MPKLQLVPECHAETAMVKALFPNWEYLNHAPGISEVNTILKKQDVDNYLNIGFIDNDKKHVPDYFNEFILLATSEDATVTFKKHTTTNDYLIVVNPAMEKFILSQLNEIKKLPSHYNLPDDFKAFKHRMKKQSIENHVGYQQLLSDLKAANTSGIRFIIKHITSLRNI
jgi:hypothetical protein